MKQEENIELKRLLACWDAHEKAIALLAETNQDIAFSESAESLGD